MKVKFYKNLYQSLSFLLSIIILDIPLLMGYYYSFNAGNSISWIFLVLPIGLIVLYVSIGFYWIFQQVIITEEGIRICLVKKTIKRVTWNDIVKIEKCGKMRNPALRVVLYNGKAIYLDDRKKICHSIEKKGKINIKLGNAFDDNLK